MWCAGTPGQAAAVGFEHINWISQGKQTPEALLAVATRMNASQVNSLRPLFVAIFTSSWFVHLCAYGCLQMFFDSRPCDWNSALSPFGWCINKFKAVEPIGSGRLLIVPIPKNDSFTYLSLTYLSSVYGSTRSEHQPLELPDASWSRWR